MRAAVMTLSSIVLIASCIEVYEQEIPRQKGFLLVESHLFNHPDHQFVKLHFTDSTGVKIPVYSALVAIHDADGNQWQLSEEEPGLYRYIASTISVEPGLQFQLEIGIGDSIRALSSWETVPDAARVDSAFLVPKFVETVNDGGFSVFQKGIEIFATTLPLPTNEVYLRWTYEEAYGYISPNAPDTCSECEYCYVIEQPSNINNIAQVSSGDGKVLSARSVDFVPASEKFGVRYSVLVKQLTITKSAYEYYAAIKQINDARGNIFDPPPAVLHGNIVNQLNPTKLVYGFFETGQYSETSARIGRPNIPFLIPTSDEKCRESIQPPAECSDCRKRKGATKDRPYYF